MAVLIIEDGKVRVEKLLIEPDTDRALYESR